MTIDHHELHYWRKLGERGLSSNAIADHLTGRKVAPGFNDPADPGDFRRCELLLRAVPGLRPLMPKMAELSPRWAGLVEKWDEIAALMEEEVPSVWGKPHPRAKAPKAYELMKSIKGPSIPEPARIVTMTLDENGMGSVELPDFEDRIVEKFGHMIQRADPAAPEPQEQYPADDWEKCPKRHGQAAHLLDCPPLDPDNADQPPGVDVHDSSRQLPPAKAAAERVSKFVSHFGDGEIFPEFGDRPALYARDLEAVVRLVLEGARPAAEQDALCFQRHPMGPGVSLAIPHHHPRPMKAGTTPSPPRK